MPVNSKAGTKTTPASIPLSNINSYVRVPGHPPYPLGRALQEWDGVSAHSYWHKDPGEQQDSRLIREIRFETPEGEFKVTVNEQLFEVALYTRATKRFTDWMKEHKERFSA